MAFTLRIDNARNYSLFARSGTRSDAHSPNITPAQPLLAIHLKKSELFTMSNSESSYSTITSSIKKAAIDRFDDLVSRPGHTDSKELEVAARARHQIKILQLTNELDTAELLDISNSCNACNSSTGPEGVIQTSVAELADAIIDDAQEKVKRMKVVRTRINNRNSQIQKLEEHLKTYDTILQSMKIVLPGDGTGYSYKIDPIDGISLIIRKPAAQTQEKAYPTDLLDTDAPLSLTAPVLEVARTSSRTSALTTTSAPASTLTPDLATPTTPSQIHTEAEKQAIAQTTKRNPKIITSQFWDTDSERDAAYREHIASYRGRIDLNSIPLVFKEELYRPFDPTKDPTTQSRMIVFSDLHPDTTYPELLDKVRGGPILHVARANRTTAAVSFVLGRDAHAYMSYINDTSHNLTIHGVAPRVTLVSTPSYPLRASVVPGVVSGGVTRCLEIPSAGNLFCWDLDRFFTERNLWAFTETRDVEYVVITVDEDEDEDGQQDSNDEMLEDMLVDDWVIVDHNDMYKLEPKQTPRPPPATTRVLRVAFRDVAQAERARGLIAWRFRGCGVRYAPDRCAGPLEELDG